MILATIMRRPTSDQGTLGALAIPELARAWTSLELPWRGNVRHLSCIAPAPGERARYRCELQPSSKWTPRDDGRLYWILDVPGRSAIEIHAATWAGDVTKGWHSDLLGCVAPGEREGELAPAAGRLQRCILQSRLALTEFMDALEGEPFDLEIAWGIA